MRREPGGRPPEWLAPLRVWGLFKYEQKAGKVKPEKVAYWAVGGVRDGELDTPEDKARHVTYDEALAVFHGPIGHVYDGLSTFLGPLQDGTGRVLQGADFDDVTDNGLFEFVAEAPGLVERSVSGKGSHVLGLGAAFGSRRNAGGLEFYDGGRHFTWTGETQQDHGAGQPVDLSEWIRCRLVPEHDRRQALTPSGGGASTGDSDGGQYAPLTPQQITDARSALDHIRADDEGIWMDVFFSLKPYGDVGRGLWFTWSRNSYSNWNPVEADERWETRPCRGDKSIASLFHLAQKLGWTNPRSREAQIGAAPAAQQMSIAEGHALLKKHRVDLSATAKAVHYLWGLYMIEGECTFLGGHGGKGKSVLALQIACHLAAGVPFLGKPIDRAYRVLFYSAEDPGDRVLRRVNAICSQAGLDRETVLANLCVIDATDFDPLFGEVQEATNVADLEDKKPFYVIQRKHTGTAEHAMLSAMVSAFDAEVLVVDGASDTFDGEEIKRTQVRAFIRLLVRTHPARRMTVLLLGHVNKPVAGTRRTQNDDEGYSGSTAWHNTARGRLFLDVSDKGQPVLKHKKNQEGLLEKDQYLIRLDNSGGIFGLPAQFGAAFSTPPNGSPAPQPAEDRTVLLLSLLHHYRIGLSTVSTAGNSSRSAYNTFKAHPKFPADWKEDAKAGRAAVQELMEHAEADGRVEREEYRDAHYNARTCWRLTEQGVKAVDAGLPLSR